jgi:hypothetical protein
MPQVRSFYFFISRELIISSLPDALMYTTICLPLPQWHAKMSSYLGCILLLKGELVTHLFLPGPKELFFG